MLGLQYSTLKCTLITGGTMNKISGLVLDIYDDPNGEILKTSFPIPEDLPEIIKHAHALTQEERNNLPDDSFALILTQDGMEFKKFATIDAGNTALSIIYFLKTAHKLPEEAQKVALNNLCCACDNYGIDPSDVIKQASVPEFQKVMVSKIPKVRERQLEALKSKGVKALTKTASITEEIASLSRYAPYLDDAAIIAARLQSMNKPTGIGPQDKTKQAFGVIPAISTALLAPGAAREAKSNLQVTRAAGSHVMTPSQVKLQRIQMGTI